MDIELTPRSSFSIELNRITQRTIDISDFLGSNTVAAITMTITDSDNTDVSSTFGKGVSESSGTVTFGVKGYAEGEYLIKFGVTLDETTPNGESLYFTFELILEVTDTSTSANAATAELLENYALVELNECKIALQIALGTTTYDSILIHMINDATAAIEKHCQRRFASTSYTDRLDGTDRKLLYLCNKPIISVSSVTIDGTAITAASDYDDDSQYWIEPKFNGVKCIGAIYRADKWDAGSQNVVVSYTAGYASIPDDIRRACNMLIKEWYNIYQNEEGLKSESIGRYSYTFAMLSKEIVEHIYTLLENYVDKGYY